MKNKNNSSQINLIQKNQLLIKDNHIIRILDSNKNKVFFIDCIKKTMPIWGDSELINGYALCSEHELQKITGNTLIDIDTLSAKNKKIAYERFTIISPILSFISNAKKRKELINIISNTKSISKQTIRYYLCLYLAYQDIAVLLPKQSIKEKELSQDEKNMRWALNKFFYSKNKNSLNTAYTLMLKEKYCNANGELLQQFPTFYQFRYFYRKTKKLQNYYISRDGIKNYQRNNRPLLGNGVQEYASFVGIGMLDATVCDIYLVNDAGDLIGRPILTACIDAYSSLCCGYSLTWEGGVYSLRGLMLNIITDKQEYCRKFGISIEKSQWDSDKLPAILVTDMGSEYKSETFEQITEIGCTVVNLPAYRPELKGSVEKFFDLLQDTYKPYLKGKGVIESDYQERGAHDYRKDACLTLTDFEKIVLRSIIYYNCQRTIENFPYTEDMLSEHVKPFANDIWKWGKMQKNANLIQVGKEEMILTLLPRTTGKFTRSGLKVNKMRYKNPNYTEKYLSGGEAIVAYNPEDVSYVWHINNNAYVRFELIESRYKGKKLAKVDELRVEQKNILKSVSSENTQAQIDLAKYIETIASTASIRINNDTNIKEIRKTRQNEIIKNHTDYAKDGELNE